MTKQIRGFLGLRGNYRRSIERYVCHHCNSTDDATKKSLPDKVQWTPECEAAFVALKRALCEAPVISNQNFDQEFVLQADASHPGVKSIFKSSQRQWTGEATAVLQQEASTT